MDTYLVFLKNAVTREEFVAPVQAHDRDEAVMAAGVDYPAPAYASLTCYKMDEMARILADARRWPGVASTVQPTLETLLRTASVKPLPPLPAKTTTTTVGAKPASGSTSVVDALRAARSAGMLQGQVKAAAPTATQTATLKAPAPAAKAVTAAAKTRSAKTASSLATPARPQSVIEVLKAMRG